MDVSQAGAAVVVALQAQLLTQMKTQGADVVKLIANAPAANTPSQGKHIDAFA